MSIKILLAEDQVVMREGLRSLIDQQADMKVVGEADDGKVAVELARKLQPDVIIMDVVMPNMNGIEAARLIKAKMPDVKIVALSVYDNWEYVMGMVRAGISGYLLKDCAFDELLRAIQTVVQNKSYLSPDITAVVLDAQADEQTISGYSGDRVVLSERDIQIIKLLAEGKSAREIAVRYNLSIKTIEGRRRRIMKKLNIDSLAELVKYAIQKELIPA